MAQTPIIVAEEVTKRFGTHQVLTRVSLPVMERDVVCVVGPSGSGKTTLLNLIAGLDRPTEGEIRVGDQCISRLSEGELAKWRTRHVGCRKINSPVQTAASRTLAVIRLFNQVADFVFRVWIASKQIEANRT